MLLVSHALVSWLSNLYISWKQQVRQMTDIYRIAVCWLIEGFHFETNFVFRRRRAFREMGDCQSVQQEPAAQICAQCIDRFSIYFELIWMHPNDKQIWGRGTTAVQEPFDFMWWPLMFSQGTMNSRRKGLDRCPWNHLGISFYWKVLLLPSPDMRHPRQLKRTRNTSRQPSGSKQLCGMLLFITLPWFDQVYTSLSCVIGVSLLYTLNLIRRIGCPTTHWPPGSDSWWCCGWQQDQVSHARRALDSGWIFNITVLKCFCV